MAKEKMTISFDREIADAIRRGHKKLGFLDVSQMVNYQMRMALKSPIEILRAKAKESNRKMQYYLDLIQTLEEQKKLVVLDDGSQISE